MRDVGQNLGASMFLTGNVAQACRLQQAAELPGQDRGFSRQILVKEVVDGVVQKCDRPNHFVRYQQRRGQQRPSPVFLSGRKDRRVDAIAENRAALAYRFGGHGTLVWAHAQANKPVGHLAIGLFANQFLAGMRAPEIDAGDLEELTGSAAEQLNQRLRVRPLARPGSNTEQQLLEGIIGARGKRTLPGND